MSLVLELEGWELIVSLYEACTCMPYGEGGRRGTIFSGLSLPPKDQVWDCIGLVEFAQAQFLVDACVPALCTTNAILPKNLTPGLLDPPHRLQIKVD